MFRNFFKKPISNIILIKIQELGKTSFSWAGRAAPLDFPRSRPAIPLKTLSYPPLLLRLTQYLILI